MQRIGAVSKQLRFPALFVFALLIFAPEYLAAQLSKEFKFTAPPSATLSLSNPNGAVTVRSWSGRTVQIVAVPASPKMQVFAEQIGNRIEVHSQYTLAQGDPKPSAAELKIDYEIQAPPDIGLFLRASSGPVHIQGMRGVVNVEGDTAAIVVVDLNGGTLQARAVNGTITLQDVRGRVEARTVAGDITMNNVSGQAVTANTTSGAIRYTGAFDLNGRYTLNTHSGPIDVTLPAAASVDLKARSVNGTVESDLALQPRTPLAAAPQSLTGSGTPSLQPQSDATQNSAENTAKNVLSGILGGSSAGSSSVQLNSLSGKIRVKKQ